MNEGHFMMLYVVFFYIEERKLHVRKLETESKENITTLGEPLEKKLITLEESGAFEEDLCSSSIHVMKTFFISIHETRVG